MTAAGIDETLSGTSALRRYLRELTNGAWGLVILTVVLALGVAATEGLGLVLLFPLLEIAGVTGPSSAVSDVASDLASRLHLVGRSAAPIVLVVYAVVMTGRAVLVRWSVIECVRLQERFLLAHRDRLFRAILASRWQAVLGHRSGTVTHALTAELEAAADAPTHLLALVTGGLITIVYLTVALRLSITVTLLSAAAGAGLLFLLRRWRSDARLAAQDVHRQTTELFAVAAEQIDGLKTTKAFGAERRSERLFAERSAEVAAANERCERLFANTRALLDAGAVILLALAVYIAFSATSLGAPGILVMLFLFARLTPRLASIQSAYQRLMLAMPPFMRVMQAIDEWEAASEGDARDDTPLQLRRALVIDRVSYRHPVTDGSGGAPPETRDHLGTMRRSALRGVTLTIRAGATTAVVGSSGAGKTTLGDVVLGLLFPDSGRIEIDGVQLPPARARAWRERLGYVGQDTYLFNGSIRDNLRLAWPDATDEEMEVALEEASARSFVAALPDGLDTVVGERGHRLSCGERQRIALARALLRRSELLILDEATSSVDAENELAIQQAVESLAGRMSVLVITHRLATVRAADVIYVMERGRIVEHGSFDSLLARDGRFAALCRAQGVAPLVRSRRLSPQR